jgi:HupE / UreJ protein
VRTGWGTRLQQAGTIALRISLVLAGAVMSASAQAHLMVAQKGTLNFSGDGAYMVLSLPVSAFKGVDDDGDRLLSGTELRAHAAGIEQQVQAGAQLLNDSQPLALQGLMLTLSPRDEEPAAPADQIVVMGRYALVSGGVAQSRPLSFKLNLFGRAPAEQVYDITITRKPEAQAVRYTPSQKVHPVLPEAGWLLADQIRNGVEHVLGGADHLLFLLVVLASLAGAQAGWRQALGTLTCFTAGQG